MPRLRSTGTTPTTNLDAAEAAAVFRATHATIAHASADPDEPTTWIDLGTLDEATLAHLAGIYDANHAGYRHGLDHPRLRTTTAWMVATFDPDPDHRDRALRNGIAPALAARLEDPRPTLIEQPVHIDHPDRHAGFLASSRPR